MKKHIFYNTLGKLAVFTEYIIIKRYLRRRSNLVIGSGVIIRGKPMIDLVPGAKVIIGKNVTLDSKNKGYFLNMHSPVKILADSENAFVEIGENSRLNGVCLHAKSSIKIGSGCLIAANTQIVDSNGHDLCFEDVTQRIHSIDTPKPIDIGDDVWVGANAIILPGTKIGNGSVIAAGSIVTQNVPEMALVAGNPARIVKKI